MPNTKGKRARTPKRRDALTFLAQAVSSQANQGAQVPHAPTSAFRVRDFMRMNPPEFYGSKVNEDPHELIDEAYKLMTIMGVRSEEKASWRLTNSKG